MKVIFLSYRSWANEALIDVARHPRISNYIHCHSASDLDDVQIEAFDLMITLGWSDELGAGVCGKIKAIGLHCAELDRYSYGSPIQLQIIDGLTVTKHRVFPFIWDDKSSRAHTHTREYSHETSLSLHGNIEEIFLQLTSTSICLLNQYIDEFPNVVLKKWKSETIIKQKRVPSDSEIEKEKLASMSTLDLYNFIRCLGAPYPNAFIEDDAGTLFFERVRFKSK